MLIVYQPKKLASHKTCDIVVRRNEQIKLVAIGVRTSSNSRRATKPGETSQAKRIFTTLLADALLQRAVDKFGALDALRNINRVPVSGWHLYPRQIDTRQGVGVVF